MSKFSFGSFNKVRLFTIDTQEFDYVSLEDLYQENGPDAVYCVRGLYIGTKSTYADESPLLATDKEYVNLPQHQLDEIKNMLADPRAIEAINNGHAGFVIEQFYQKRFKKYCYVARWVDYTEAVADSITG